MFNRIKLLISLMQCNSYSKVSDIYYENQRLKSAMRIGRMDTEKWKYEAETLTNSVLLLTSLVWSFDSQDDTSDLDNKQFQRVQAQFEIASRVRKELGLK